MMPVQYVPRVIVKFRDNLINPDVNDAADLFLNQLTAGHEWMQLKAQLKLQDFLIQKLFTAVSQARLLELINIATHQDPTYHPPNFLTYFSVPCPPNVNPEAVAHAFSSQSWQDRVQFAYVEGAPSLPQVPNPGRNPDWTAPGTPPCTPPGTAFLRKAPAGIDAEDASWKIDGGDGGAGNLQLLDIETDWDLTHPDLPKLSDGNPAVQHVYGDLYYTDPSLPPNYFRDHGTAVLGIVVAQDNDLLSLGITPHLSTIMVSSMWKQLTSGEYSPNAPDAILDAISRLRFGDVLLLEIQITDKNLPVESETHSFDVIRLGTALGIVIVEAAGNYWNDLDDIPRLNRNSPEFKDSGAMMVSAATPDEGCDLTYVHAPRIDTIQGIPRRAHNYGSRIDCYAWSDFIRTTRIVGEPGADARGGGNFGDTSGAAAIIAGAALSVQGMAEKQLGYRLSPLQMRNILSDPTTGTRSKDPANDQLGVMPDLKTIIENTLNLVPDVYIRDYVGEDTDGLNPTGVICSSPDIILRPPPLLDPLINQGLYASDPQAAIDKAFGPGSGTEDDVALSVVAQQGKEHAIYVRVRNRGGAAADVTATVYWSEPASLVDPSKWNLIDSTVIPNVPPCKVLTVSPNPITWSNVPAPGHYCFVAVIGTPQDPAPQPADFLNFPNAWDYFVRYVRDNNNVAWRNFNVVDNVPLYGYGPDLLQFQFYIRGPFDQARPMRLEVVANLPAEARVMLQVPMEEWKVLRALQEIGPIERDERERLLRVRLNPHGRSRTREILFPNKFEVKSYLLVDIPGQSRRYPSEVYIRQLYQEWEVGRITWRLVPLRR